MESLFLDRLQEFGDFINWAFLFIFMMVSWLVNEIFKSAHFVARVKHETFLRTMAVGLVLALIFFFLEGDLSGHEVLRYLCSMFFAMFIMWDGLKKWFKSIKEKFPRI